MNGKTTHAGAVSTAAASGGVVGAIVVIGSWALSLAHVTVPAEVAAAAMVVLAPLVHLLAVRLGISVDAPSDAPVAPAAPVAPVVVTPTPAA